jgi:hypothetical protein
MVLVRFIFGISYPQYPTPFMGYPEEKTPFQISCASFSKQSVRELLLSE